MADKSGEVWIEDMMGQVIESGTIETIHRVVVRDGNGNVVRTEFSRDENLTKALALIIGTGEKAVTDTFVGVVSGEFVLKIAEVAKATLVDQNPAKKEAIRKKLIDGMPEPIRKLLGLE